MNNCKEVTELFSEYAFLKVLSFKVNNTFPPYLTIRKFYLTLLREKAYAFFWIRLQHLNCNKTLQHYKKYFGCPFCSPNEIIL
jgi:hypothetical protein